MSRSGGRAASPMDRTPWIVMLLEGSDVPNVISNSLKCSGGYEEAEEDIVRICAIADSCFDDAMRARAGCRF